MFTFGIITIAHEVHNKDKLPDSKIQKEKSNGRCVQNPYQSLRAIAGVLCVYKKSNLWMVKTLNEMNNNGKDPLFNV